MRSYGCIVLVILLILSHLSIAGNAKTNDPQTDIVSWTTGANMPTSRYAAVTGCAFGYMFVAQGAITNTFMPFHTAVCERYDIVNDTWSNMNPAPTARRAMGLGQVQVGDVMYSVGGITGMNMYTGANEAYDMGGNAWTVLAPCTPRAAHGAGTAFWINSHVYVFGGIDATGALLTSTERYDIFANFWGPVAPLPVATANCAGASLNNKIYCIGGDTGGGMTSAAWVYDPAWDTWSAIANLPAPRRYCTAVGDPTGNRVYVFGGEIAGSFTASVLSYDPTTDIWVDEGNMPGARGWAACGQDYNGYGYVFGGGSGIVMVPNFNNNTWIGQFPPSMAVDITYVSGSPVPANGGNINFDIYIANTSMSALAFDAWLDIVYQGGAPSTVVLRSFTNYLPGWAINRPNMYYPISGSYAGGNYDMYVRVGSNPNVIWAQDSFAFTKSGAAEAGIPFIPFKTTAPFPDPFGEIDKGEGLAGRGDLAPTEFALHGAYPNPFNPSTSISFDLPESCHLSLTIYDLQGRVVAELVDGVRDAGTHEINWNASGMASGLYFYRLEAGEFTASGKMVLMK